jgi:hypothetical protein
MILTKVVVPERETQNSFLWKIGMKKKQPKRKPKNETE